MRKGGSAMANEFTPQGMGYATGFTIMGASTAPIAEGKWPIALGVGIFGGIVVLTTYLLGSRSSKAHDTSPQESQEKPPTSHAADAERSQEGSDAPITREPASGRVITVAATRQSVICEVFALAEKVESASPFKVSIDSVVEKVEVPLDSIDNDNVYNTIVGAIRVQLRKTELRGQPILGMAVSVPGLVDVDDKFVPKSPAMLLDDSSPAGEIAALMHTDLAPLLGASKDANEIAKTIFVDNDANSLGRYLVHQNDKNRINYACVYIGDGVGSSVILNREMYHGKDGRAGEIGHQILHLAPQTSIDLTRQGDDPESPSRTLELGSCHCDKSGLHYEAALTPNGIVLLAKALNVAAFNRIARWSSVNPANMTYDDLAHAAQEALKLRKSESFSIEDCDYLRAFIHQYAYQVVVGIANLTNILDLDHVVLTGPVITAFDRVDRFRTDRSKHLKALTHSTPKVATDIHLHKSAGRGAALLFADPGYAQFFGHTETLLNVLQPERTTTPS